MLEQKRVPQSTAGLITPGLNAVYYYITFDCNLRCLHCYVGQNLAPQSHAALPLVARNLRTCHAHGARNLILLGGETTLHPEYARIVALATEIGYERITVDTNGVGGDPVPPGAEHLDRLAFRLSFEGATAATHDAIRGQGAFQRTLKTVRQLVAAGRQVEVTLTLNALNWTELQPMLDRFVDEGVRDLNVHFISLMGNARVRRHLALRPEQILEAQDLLQAFAQRDLATLRYPRLLVPVRELQQHRLRGCTCRIHRPEIVLIFPRGEMRRCPLEITAGLTPETGVPPQDPFDGCPLWWRLLPGGLPEGYAMTCISWKDH